MKLNQSTVKSVLLCGGKINFLNLPIRSNTSNSMIPVNGKPVISWILEDLFAKGLLDVVVVHRTDDVHLSRFLLRSFSARMNLTLVPLLESPTILHSLKAGLESFGNEAAFNVILGDTLIKDSFDFTEDMVYTAPVEDSTRWCIVSSTADGFVKDFYDKQENLQIKLNALCGFYHIEDYHEFYKFLLKTILDGGNQLSDVLEYYARIRPIRMKGADSWFDFGNIENLLDAKRQLLQSRYFNSLYIHPVLNTITKESEFDEKLRNELNWYEELPAELSVLAPRILHIREKAGRLVFTQEYYGYPTLSELYLYSDLSREAWHAILKKLFQIHGEFNKYSTIIELKELRAIYIDKTFSRINELLTDSPEWKCIFESKELIINGIRHTGFAGLKNQIIAFAENMIKHSNICIIHGDLCFSNILYDVNSQIVKLIDPRGSFGKKGIFGDPRYDMAKLRHSISGLYDYIVSDLFEVSANGNSFKCTIYANEVPEQVVVDFDEQLPHMGFDVKEIMFIEGLLFISMLPLHKDKPKRQEMMFVQGMKLLNNVINQGEKNSNSYRK